MTKKTLIKLFLLFCLELLIINIGYSQAPSFKGLEKEYSPIVSKGLLPEIFTKSATEKTYEEYQKIEKKSKNKTDQKQFYLESNFYLDRVIKSGLILFNDTISQFVNSVLDEILKTKPELRNHLKIYVVKSDVVNAYCFDNGIILVNMGLISQLENEAQLASILCHEVSHFTKKHSMESFVNYQNMRRGKISSHGFDEFKYSQKSELEADNEGVLLYKTTNYSYKGINGGFNLLKYSYLPFDEVEFKKSFFEDSNFVFPKDYFLAETAPINDNEDIDDKRCTHPNIKKRKESANATLGSIDDTGRQKFIVGQNQFYYIRELARFELCKLELIEREYIPCIYNCYLLLKKYPNNVYLKECIAKSLYNIAAVKSPTKDGYKEMDKLDLIDSRDGSTIDTDHYKKEGFIQQVYHLFNKLNATQSAALSLHFNLKQQQSNVNNKLFPTLVDSSIVLLAVNNGIDYNYFEKETKQNYLAQLKVKAGVNTDTNTSNKTNQSTLANLNDDDENSRVKKIEKENARKELDQSKKNLIVQEEKSFEKFALVNCFKKEEVETKFIAAQKLRDQIELIEENRKYYKKKKNRGGLGIDTILIMNPFYYCLDERKENKLKYISSNLKLLRYFNTLTYCADKAKVNYKTVNFNNFGTNDMDLYNDYVLINDWKEEFLNHDFNSNSLVLNNQTAQHIREKYNTNYILYNGIVNYRVKKENVGYAVLLTLAVYPAIVTIPYLLRKEEYTYYFSVLYNLKNNRVEYYNREGLKSSDSEDYLNAFTYNTMINIKQKPKFK
ncbi:MAG: M48 family metallopeptidase [Bacteroidetes bacterium]|nr:M48 family metallopeptidase [Bacteroidota bacterium]